IRSSLALQPVMASVLAAELLLALVAGARVSGVVARSAEPATPGVVPGAAVVWANAVPMASGRLRVSAVASVFIFIVISFCWCTRRADSSKRCAPTQSRDHDFNAGHAGNGVCCERFANHSASADAVEALEGQRQRRRDRLTVSLTKERFMKTGKRIAAGAVTVVLLASLPACSGMSRQGRNTAIGAGAGAVGGAVLTGGSTLGTLGGAAIGGVVGHEASK